jgi:hypothetical protein
MMDLLQKVLQESGNIRAAAALARGNRAPRRGRPTMTARLASRKMRIS